MALDDLNLDLARAPAPLPIWHAVVDRAGWLARTTCRVLEWPAGVDVGHSPGRRAGARAACCCVRHGARAAGRGAASWPHHRKASRICRPTLPARRACSAPRATWSASPPTAATSGPGCATAPGRKAGIRCVTARCTNPEGAGPNLPSDYDFVQLGGEGAHEIPVGPIHAGIIEPGHFRFSVIGESVLRLEQRLGYQHKGVEHRLIGQDIATAARQIGRVSGDATCAFAWAYATAVESACGCRAAAARAGCAH